MKPSFILTVFLFAFLSAKEDDDGRDCCEKKIVGGKTYMLAGKFTKEEAKEYYCSSPCLYTMEGDDEKKFCFKPGSQESKCAVRPDMGSSMGPGYSTSPGSRPPRPSSDRPDMTTGMPGPTGGSGGSGGSGGGGSTNDGSCDGCSYTAYTGDFTEKILTVTQTWDQEPAGYDRTATAYLPDTPATSGKLPVVIDLHGFGGKGMKRWKDIGDQIIFVGADGYCPPDSKCSWNVFGEPSKAPDTEFILELIAKIGTEVPEADMDNVNIVGTSNGAALTYLLTLSTGSDRPFRRAIPMSSSLIDVQYNNDKFWKFSTPAVSGENNVYDTAMEQSFADNFEYVHFHGTEDGVIAYEGGYSGVVGTDALSAQETDFVWAKALGYSGAAWTEADAVEVSGSTADNQIMEYKFLDGQVRHYKMIGANHVEEPTNTLAKQILLDVILN